MCSITVIVPTYRRVHDLERCLNSLKLQTVLAEQVLVIVRDSDQETWDFFETFELEALPVERVSVVESGVVAALNAGLMVASGEIISMTDDDAAPHPDWLERIHKQFSQDQELGGVGGRDLIYFNDRLQSYPQFGETQVVGKVQWFGRTIGNHHLGAGNAREVDLLKGVNMSFRKTAIEGLKFDHRLLGTGAQVYNEMLFSLEVKKRGWKLIYDPAISVDHYPSQRFDEDQRNNFDPTATLNQSHNESLSVLMYVSPLHKLVFVIWSVLVGTRRNPGLFQLFRLLPQETSTIFQRTFFCQLGRLQGLSCYLHNLPWQSS